MEKIIVIGCAGSGKSYFSTTLHNITNIPVYHLDKLYWKENWNHLELTELSDKLNEIMEGDSWILDGTFSKILEERFKKCNTVFFLDIPEEICLESVEKRRNNKRDDFPEFLFEEYDQEFIDIIKNFKNTTRIMILDLMKKYPKHKYIIFKSREEINEYLNNFKENYNGKI